MSKPPGAMRVIGWSLPWVVALTAVIAAMSARRAAELSTGARAALDAPRWRVEAEPVEAPAEPPEPVPPPSTAPPLEISRAAVVDDRCQPDACRLELVFSAGVDPSEVARHIASSPPARWRQVESGPKNRRRVLLRADDLEHATDVTVRLSERLCSSAGGCLAGPRIVSFHTAGDLAVHMPVRASVIPPGKKLPLRFDGVEHATLTLVPLAAADVAAALALVGAHAPDATPLASLPLALVARAVVLPLAIDDHARADGLEIDAFAEAKAPLLLAVLSAEHAQTKVAMLQKGELAAMMKVGETSGLVWVTDTASGKPVGGATVQVMHGAKGAFTGVTDAQGLMRLPARSRLALGDAEATLAAVVRSGARAALTHEEHSDGLSAWMFDLPREAFTGPNALRGMVTAERGIYRPGDTVHLLGILRRRLESGLLGPPQGEARFVLKNPRGEVVTEVTANVSAFGTVRQSVELASYADVGRYQVALRHGEHEVLTSFEVGEFKSASFEVALPDAASEDADFLLVPLRARYLQGGPLAKQGATWSVSWRRAAVRAAGAESFRFVAEDDEGDAWAQLTDGEADLDENGEAVLHIPKSALPGAGEAPVVELLLEATVTDAADDAVTARTVLAHQLAETVAGVDTRQWVVSPKEGWTVELVALKNGAMAAGQALEVSLHRSFWRTAAERGPHGVRYRSNRERELVEERTVESGAAPIDVHFDIAGGGEYELSVRPKGGGYAATRSMWAYGDEATAPAENTPRMDLHLDREAYEPGEVARVYAENPYARATALVTVERAGVLSARVMELDGATPIELPVTQAHLPNAFVSVAVVPRSDRNGEPATGNPFRAGYAELAVSAASRRLAVEVVPEATELLPGGEAVVKVRVRDDQGRPAAAEVTVWAADEGVLMLTGYATPDPFAPVYARHALEVATALNLVRWASDDPGEWLDGGGDSGTGATALRSRLLPTAFFSQGVVTNATGEATVRFALPDNLTRWRVMAVAADRGQRFGKGEGAVTASKPLAVMAALPRFLVEGDLLDAGFVVHNQTGAAVDARVTLSVYGAKLAGDAETTLAVAAGAQAPVRFPLIVGSAGEVTLEIAVEAGAHRDRLEVTLPVHAPTARQHVLAAEGALDASSAGATVTIPEDARAGSAELVVSASSSRMAAIEPSVRALIEYPHGCAEQKTSPLVAMLSLEGLVDDLGLTGLEGEPLRERLQATLASLEGHQNDDGGFGLWVESDTDPFITAYVLFGMTVARFHGYDVPASVTDPALAYLDGKIDGGLGAGYFDYDARALTAYVLALNGKDDHGLAAKLFEGRASLSRFEHGLLAAALLASDGAKATTVLDELVAAATPRGAGTAIAETGASQYYGFGQDARATAAAAMALTLAGRASDAAPLLAGVLALRDGDGTWGATYNNLWALHAIGVFAQTLPPARAATVRVRLGDRVLGEMKLSKQGVGRLVVPAELLPAPGQSVRLALETSAPSADASYTIRLAYDDARTTELSSGYHLTRELLDAASGEAVERPAVGQLVRVRVTVKTDAARHQVAITDRLPAGLEAVDGRLETSQRTALPDEGAWRSFEVRDDRVSFFADDLEAGAHQAEYLARVSRSGDFAWPAATAASMYAPGEHGQTATGRLTVDR